MIWDMILILVTSFWCNCKHKICPFNLLYALSIVKSRKMNTWKRKNCIYLSRLRNTFFLLCLELKNLLIWQSDSFMEVLPHMWSMKVLIKVKKWTWVWVCLSKNLQVNQGTQMPCTGKNLFSNSASTLKN